MFDEDSLNEVRKAAQGRLTRITERAMLHDTRARIVKMLAEDGGKVELSETYISGQLPGKRRGNEHHARHHLRVLRRCGVVVRDDSKPPNYRLR